MNNKSLICKKCNGVGMVYCMQCKGRRFYPFFSPVVCNICNGQGYYECSECNGTGHKL